MRGGQCLNLCRIQATDAGSHGCYLRSTKLRQCAGLNRRHLRGGNGIDLVIAQHTPLSRSHAGELATRQRFNLRVGDGFQFFSSQRGRLRCAQIINLSGGQAGKLNVCKGFKFGGRQGCQSGSTDSFQTFHAHAWQLGGGERQNLRAGHAIDLGCGQNTNLWACQTCKVCSFHGGKLSGRQCTNLILTQCRCLGRGEALQVVRRDRFQVIGLNELNLRIGQGTHLGRCHGSRLGSGHGLDQCFAKAQ